MSPDPRSVEAMEAERRALERAKVHAPTRQVKPKERNTARSERFFNPAEAMAELRAKMRANPGAPEKLYRCGVCQDTGWEEVDPSGHGTYRYCRRGCEIPRKKERTADVAPSKPVSIS